MSVEWQKCGLNGTKNKSLDFAPFDPSPKQISTFLIINAKVLADILYVEINSQLFWFELYGFLNGGSSIL